MPEPYPYSLQDAPSGGPHKGPRKGARADADETNEAPARIWHFLRQLALLLVLSWVLSFLELLIAPGASSFADAGMLWLREIVSALTGLAFWLAGAALPLLLYSRAAARPLPARGLALCLLFCCCTRFTMQYIFSFLPYQPMIPLFIFSGIIGWVCGRLAAGADALLQTPQEARRLAHRLGLLLGGMTLYLPLPALLWYGAMRTPLPPPGLPLPGQEQNLNLPAAPQSVDEPSQHTPKYLNKP